MATEGSPLFSESETEIRDGASRPLHGGACLPGQKRDALLPRCWRARLPAAAFHLREPKDATGLCSIAGHAPTRSERAAALPIEYARTD
jgi:hypothetical protein